MKKRKPAAYAEKLARRGKKRFSAEYWNWKNAVLRGDERARKQYANEHSRKFNPNHRAAKDA